MADNKTTIDYEKEFIANAKAQTGHSVDEWMDVIRASGKKKHAEVRDWIKSEHKLDHMKATFLAFMFDNGGKPAFVPDDLLDALFAGKQQARELTTALETAITSANAGIRFVPKKTYVSIDGDKVLGCATPTKDGVRLGLDLGDMPFEGRVLKAKSLGAMPNLTHMLEIREKTEIDGDVLKLVDVAFERTRKKPKK